MMLPTEPNENNSLRPAGEVDGIRQRSASADKQGLLDEISESSPVNQLTEASPFNHNNSDSITGKIAGSRWNIDFSLPSRGYHQLIPLNTSCEDDSSQQTRQSIYEWLLAYVQSLPRASVLSAFGSVVYITMAIALVLFNKWMLSRAGFPFPLTLSMSYAFVKTCLSISFVFGVMKQHFRRSPFMPSKISWEFFFSKLVPVGVFFGIDVALTNMAFKYSSVGLTEIIKSGIPVLVLGFSAFTKQEKLTASKFVVILALTLGICLASFGEVGFSAQGFFSAFGATIAGAVKLVLAERMFKNGALDEMIHPMLTLMYFAPVVVGTLLIPSAIFEWSYMSTAGINVPATVIALLFGGIIGFAMVLGELYVVEHTSALTVCVVGTGKIVLIIFIAAAIFEEPMEMINLLGCMVCVLGIALYNFIKWHESQDKKQQTLRETLSPVFGDLAMDHLDFSTPSAKRRVSPKVE
eukprot:TRINITY_DN1840_c0_g1_i1.p1 TRINITY_DN1840_c0_g1~~TRINITY_DN1840_c0_g1_i1.p1  ORF type:complete len:465 (-),score=94.56 TRINITY_DN1840_c0_g1_i1:29-1423(-)